MITTLIAVSAIAFTQSSVTDEERTLWKRAVTPYVTQPTWDDGRNYTVGHTMMVPMHGAFLLKEEPWIQEFAAYFKRFANEGMRDYTGWEENGSARQRKIQYMYLVSRFIVLATKTNRPELIPSGMVDFLGEAVDDIWNRGKMIAWQGGSFDSMKDCLKWKLETMSTAKSYFRAIVDEERFTQAIAGDLKAYELLVGKKVKGSKAIDEVLEYALMTYKQRVSYTDGDAWVFQPGVWVDHPDYSYSAVNVVSENMKPSSRFNISEDSSHSHRTPLWLTSLSEAYKVGSPNYEYYRKLRSGLAKQFLTKVLVKPKPDFEGVRLMNYLDGSNGVYRWEYKNLGGAGRGYQPYGLSFVFMIGWWSFLDNDDVRKAYAAQLSTFPLKDRELMTYYAELTDEEKQALLADPAKRLTQRTQWQVSTSIASKLKLD